MLPGDSTTPFTAEKPHYGRGIRKIPNNLRLIEPSMPYEPPQIYTAAPGLGREPGFANTSRETEQ